MVKKLSKLISIVSCVCALVNTGRVMANTVMPRDTIKKATPKVEEDKGDDKQISAMLTTPSKTAVFEDVAKYTYIVKNPTDNQQVGTVSYKVTTETGKLLNVASVNVKIAKRGTGSYNFEIPESNPGFYKISVMVNITDYDDTTRRAFGIKPSEIRSSYPKPADFDEFWYNTKADLASVKPEFKMTYLPDSTRDNRKVYLVEWKSLDNLTIRAYLTVPIVNKHKKFAVLLGLPGYQVSLPPMFGTDNDLAIMTVNVRGQGNSRDVIHTPRNEYIFYHIEDKNKYVMRGAIMDCLRAVDFIFTQPNLQHDHIMVSGGSMGGFLSIATASLDKRVALCSAQNPILSDVHNLPGETDWPFYDIGKYIRSKPGLTLDKVLSNLDYFDTKNFASELTCPTVLGIGLLDNIVPPNNAYTDYNNMKCKKHIIIFRDLAHEVGASYKGYEGRWMRDTFGLF
jgi:cephalosporin-C deacetylase